jgi:fibro-slime domain-containing protein
MGCQPMRSTGVRFALALIGALASTAAGVACGESGRSEFDEADSGRTRDGGVASFRDGSVPIGDAGRDGDCGPNLTGVLRDFRASHPDFEDFDGDDRGIVAEDLGVDGKPVYARPGPGPTTSGKDAFDQWYRDVQDVNTKELFTVPLVPIGNGISSFASSAFFPFDGKGFGNEGREHNYHFTFELHTEFIYRGGEVFTFIGDDDVFTFINGKLAIDIGGVHVAETASVALDDNAGRFGIEKGGIYPLDVFHAERHTSESNFRIDTTIEFTNCDAILK